MAEAPTAIRSGNGTLAASHAEARSHELARTLYRKLAQGFEIESESETEAVVVMKGRRRWFGLASASIVRYHISVDEAGTTTSRRL